jgi:pilus assembly protein CpaB
VAEVAAGAAPPRSRAPRGTLIGGIVALVSFLLLVPLIAVLAHQPAATSSPGQRVAVVVASKNLSAREPLGAGGLTVKQMYPGDVPAGAYTQLAQLKGMMAAASISVGQPITPSLVARSGEDLIHSELPLLPLPVGYVALTLPTSEQQGVAGYIQPGDFVTVVAVVAPQGASGTANARTIFTNLHVLKVGLAPQKTTPSQAAQPAASASLSSLTVMTTQCQAEILNWFLANAQIKYTLESHLDYPASPAPDQGCPGINSAQGINKTDIARRYPGIFN